VVAALLRHRGICQSVEEGITYFASKRSTKGGGLGGVSVPSQKRFLPSPQPLPPRQPHASNPLACRVCGGACACAVRACAQICGLFRQGAEEGDRRLPGQEAQVLLCSFSFRLEAVAFVSRFANPPPARIVRLIMSPIPLLDTLGKQVTDYLLFIYYLYLYLFLYCFICYYYYYYIIKY
jgi:hypothetical protein